MQQTLTAFTFQKAWMILLEMRGMISCATTLGKNSFFLNDLKGYRIQEFTELKKAQQENYFLPFAQLLKYLLSNNIKGKLDYVPILINVLISRFCRVKELSSWRNNLASS